MPRRFDYVQYDEKSNNTQAAFKAIAINFVNAIEEHVQCPRSKASALTNLELVYMWIGKGIRNDQIKRNSNTNLQEGRSNS